MAHQLNLQTNESMHKMKMVIIMTIEIMITKLELLLIAKLIRHDTI